MSPDEISRRLKAARWLLGSLVDGKAKALSTTELAAHPVLVANRISKNRLEDIEQLRIKGGPRRWELEQLEEALGLPGWFGVLDEKRATDEAVQRAGELLGPLLLAAGQALRREREQAQPDTDVQDRPSTGEGVGGE